MRRWVWVALVALPLLAHAQPVPKLHRIGIIYQGGAYESMVEGLRVGLREARLVEGRNYVLHMRLARSGSAGDVEQVAKQLEAERVDMIFSITTTISLRTKQATREVPIVFYAGNDPVRVGLVKSFAKPGDRLTGVHHVSTALTAKRLEVLQRVLPGARRVACFYHRTITPTTRDSLEVGRQAAKKLGLELVEREFDSLEDLLAQLRALRPGEVDAFFSVGDPLVTAVTAQIVPIARARKIPLVMADQRAVDLGALAAYGHNFLEVGRLAARPVRLVLEGTKPQDIPVELYDRVQLALNLQVARDLGITIAEPVILRADRVIR
jgi:putative tryptophan/tyrosine transport system substrate-binding protein